MLKKTIKYTDFEDNQREEDFYFNLTKAEAFELEFSKDGGVSGFIRRVTAEQNKTKIVEFFKEFVLKTVGIKSPDGKRFMKSDEIRQAFADTQAYSDLFMELATNAESAAAFIKGVLPVDMQPK